MTRWKTTVVLLLLTVGLGTYVSQYELKKPTTEEQQVLAKRVVQVASDQAVRLEVQTVSTSAVLERVNDAWRLVSPLDARADESVVRRLLNELDPLDAERVLTDSKKQLLALDEFGLQAPRARLGVTAGTQMVSLAFGEATPVGKRRYLKLPDSPRVFIIDQALFDELNQPLETYRSHKLLAFDALKTSRIALVSSTASYTLAKHGESWQLEEPLADDADGSAVSTVVSKLQRLRIERFLSDHPSGDQLKSLEPPFARVRIGLGEKEPPLELVIGATTSDKSDQRYAKRMDEPTLYAVTQSSLDDILQDPQALRSHACLSFLPSQVIKVQVTWQGASWTAEQRDKHWKLVEPHGQARGTPFPRPNWGDTPPTRTNAPTGKPVAPGGADGTALDSSKMDDWLWRLHSLKLTRFVEDDPKDLARYGLTTPEGTIQVWESGAKDPKELLIGKTVEQGKTRYGRLTGRKSVVEFPETLNDLVSNTPKSLATPPLTPKPTPTPPSH